MKNVTNEVCLEIISTESGIGINAHADSDESSRDGVFLRWQSLEKIKAYNRDLLTTDLVCLGLYTSESDFLEINEEMIGFGNLVESLPKSLPGFPDQQEWWEKIVKPAFAANSTKLWQRTGEQDV